jgi:hypothetical protein
MAIVRTSAILILVAAFGLLGYSIAEAKPGSMHGACKHADKDCPMHAVSELADLKVEKTKSGASLVFTVKDAAKLAELQALVEKMGEHMSAKGCGMSKAGEPQAGGHAPDAGAAHSH